MITLSIRQASNHLVLLSMQHVGWFARGLFFRVSSTLNFKSSLCAVPQKDSLCNSGPSSSSRPLLLVTQCLLAWGRGDIFSCFVYVLILVRYCVPESPGQVFLGDSTPLLAGGLVSANISIPLSNVKGFVLFPSLRISEFLSVP